MVTSPTAKTHSPRTGSNFYPLRLSFNLTCHNSYHRMRYNKDMGNILLTVAAVLVLFWLIGVFLHILGTLIYIALVLAALIFVYDVLVVRRRTPKE